MNKYEYIQFHTPTMLVLSDSSKIVPLAIRL